MATLQQDVLLTNCQDCQSANETHIDLEIHHLVHKIHGRIESVNKQIEHIVSKNESEFVFAYKNHLTKIKKQLAQISKKSEQQQKMFSADDRIKFLEKQVAIFREQTLKTYQKLTNATQETNKYKHKYEDLLQSYRNCEKLSKQSLKHSKQTQAIKIGLESKIKQLELKLEQKDTEIRQLQNKNTKRTVRSNDRYKVNSLVSQRSNQSSSKLLKTSTKMRQSMFKLLQDEYREYFCVCMKHIKKQIALRKSAKKIDLSTIQDLNEFREIDKIALLVEFFSHPKLESDMLQILFGNMTVNSMRNHENFVTRKINISQTNTKMRIYGKIKGEGLELPKMDVKIKSLLHKNNLSML